MLKLVVHELKAPLNGLAGYTRHGRSSRLFRADRTLADTDTKHKKEFKLLSNTAQFALDNAHRARPCGCIYRTAEPLDIEYI